MKGFFLGLAVATLGFAGYLYWRGLAGGMAPGRSAVVTSTDAVPPVKKNRKRSRGVTRVARSPVSSASAPAPLPEPPPDPEPQPVRLGASDVRIVGEGDDLSRPDVLRLDVGDDQEQKELSQDEIDERFRAGEASILGCITSSRPDPETYVPGRVTIKFRIQRSGQVRGVRVEAPAILMRGGLFSCVKGIVGRLRFPASGGSQIVTYPFTLT